MRAHLQSSSVRLCCVVFGVLVMSSLHACLSYAPFLCMYVFEPVYVFAVFSVLTRVFASGSSCFSSQKGALQVVLLS